MSYKGFLIAPFEQGMDKSLEPWLTPDKAFSKLENVYIDRGIMKKRGGVSEFGQLGRYLEGETFDTPDGGATYTHTPAETLIEGSISITSSSPAQTIYINKKGVATGDGTGSINNIGLVTVTFSSVVAAGTIKCTYHYSDTGDDRIVRGVHLFNRDVGTEQLLAMDKRRLNRWNSTYEYFENIPSGTAVTGETPLTSAGGNRYTRTLSNLPIVPFTVHINHVALNVYDNGYGLLVGDIDTTGVNTIDYTTGAIDVTFSAAAGTNATVDYHHAATKVWDTFNSANLVWGRAWQDLYWFCDNSSNIHIYNGTYVIDISPRMKLDAAGTTVLQSARCMEIFNERPIFFDTVENGIRYSNRARWPGKGNSLAVNSFRDDIDGEGDFNDATTSDEIITTMNLKGRTVVRFENTIGFFIYTGNPDLPYRWEMLDTEIETDSTFGIWNFKQLAFGVGKYEMSVCNGVTAEKANVKIPDFTMDIDYDHIDKCYGHVIPEKRQAWLAYPSREAGLGFPDKVLVFNYDENVVSEYDFHDGLFNPLQIRCLEKYRYAADVTYTDLYNGTYWDDVSSPASYSDYAGYTYEQLAHQSKEFITLAGSKDGYIYIVDNSNVDNDNGDDFNFNITTKKYNPFNEEGRKVSLGAVDFLVSAIGGSKIEVKFYLGFSNNATGTLTKEFVCSDVLDSKESKIWKRVYCNAEDNVIGYSLSHPIGSRTRAYNVEIHAHKPHFKKGGKLL